MFMFLYVDGGRFLVESALPQLLEELCLQEGSVPVDGDDLVTQMHSKGKACAASRESGGGVLAHFTQGQ